MIQRRAFLGGLMAALAAPAIVRASSLMPVRSIERLNADLTIYVDHYKPGAFRTIQAAMEHIERLYPLGNSTVTMQIGPGTFEGPIRVDLSNNLTVKGYVSDGDYTTNITAPRDGYALVACRNSVLKVDNLNFGANSLPFPRLLS